MALTVSFIRLKVLSALAAEVLIANARSISGTTGTSASKKKILHINYFIVFPANSLYGNKTPYLVNGYCFPVLSPVSKMYNKLNKF